MLSVREIENIIVKIGRDVPPSTLAQAVHNADKAKWKEAMLGTEGLRIPQPLWSYEPPQMQESSAIVTARLVLQILANQNLGPESQKAYKAAVKLLTEQMEAMP